MTVNEIMEFLLDPTRVSLYPAAFLGKTDDEVLEGLEKLARKGADPRAQCSPWFREARTYPARSLVKP